MKEEYDLEKMLIKSGSSKQLMKRNATIGGIMLSCGFLLLVSMFFFMLPNEDEIVAVVAGYKVTDRVAMYILAMIILIIQAAYKIKGFRKDIEQRY